MGPHFLLGINEILSSSFPILLNLERAPYSSIMTNLKMGFEASHSPTLREYHHQKSTVKRSFQLSNVRDQSCGNVVGGPRRPRYNRLVTGQQRAVDSVGQLAPLHIPFFTWQGLFFFFFSLPYMLPLLCATTPVCVYTWPRLDPFYTSCYLGFSVKHLLVFINSVLGTWNRIRGEVKRVVGHDSYERKTLCDGGWYFLRPPIWKETICFVFVAQKFVQATHSMMNDFIHRKFGETFKKISKRCAHASAIIKSGCGYSCLTRQGWRYKTLVVVRGD